MRIPANRSIVMSSRVVRFGTISAMPQELDPRSVADDGHAAANSAASLRVHLRGRTKKTDASRISRIGTELDRLDDVAGPLRSVIGRLPYITVITQAEIAYVKDASKRLQYERSQLKKMLPRGRRF